MRIHDDHATTLRESQDGFRPRLSKYEIVTIIDALLQAEMTLPLLDERNRSRAPVQRLQSMQLALAERLEDLLAADTQLLPPPP